MNKKNNRPNYEVVPVKLRPMIYKDLEFLKIHCGAVSIGSYASEIIEAYVAERRLQFVQWIGRGYFSAQNRGLYTMQELATLALKQSGDGTPQ